MAPRNVDRDSPRDQAEWYAAGQDARIPNLASDHEAHGRAREDVDAAPQRERLVHRIPATGHSTLALCASRARVDSSGRGLPADEPTSARSQQARPWTEVGSWKTQRALISSNSSS
jgi:hypothetical protein